MAGDVAACSFVTGVPLRAIHAFDFLRSSGMGKILHPS